jgi:hypothetical protein
VSGSDRIPKSIMAFIVRSDEFRFNAEDSRRAATRYNAGLCEYGRAADRVQEEKYFTVFVDFPVGDLI